MPRKSGSNRGLGLSLGEESTEVNTSYKNVQVNLDHLRLLVKDSLDKNLCENAIFFANKLNTLSTSDPSDVHLLAQCYYSGKQFRRAVHLIQSHGFLMKSGSDTNVDFVLLAAQALVASDQHEEAQNVLDNFLGPADHKALRRRARRLTYHIGCINALACLCLLQGRVAQHLDNRQKATEWYKAALFCDIFCGEAFDLLVNNQLQPSEEASLMQELEECGAFSNESEWLKPIYESRLNKYDYTRTVDERFEALNHVKSCKDISLAADLDCEADKAAALFTQHDTQRAFQITKHIREKDPYHLRSCVVYLASLVELGNKTELFHISHTLVEAYPTNAISWFAVGCYYYAIEKFDNARRFFHKATTMDSSFAEAWLGFGHAFAAQDESDQAMAAYRAASRLFVGSHIPVLCTAIEYLRTNNVSLAEQFCKQAESMCTSDPLVLNEYGVVCFRQHRYQKARDYFLASFELCKSQPERLRFSWEPAMFNLAHTYRKLGEYDRAIYFYEMALSYNPREASTYTALGFSYHLQGKYELAIQNYHSALGLKPEDTIASEFLFKALTQAYTEESSEIDPTADSDNANLPLPPSASKPPFNVHVSGSMMEF